MIKTNADNNYHFENDDHDEGASGASGDLFRVSDEDLWPGETTSSTSAGYDEKDDGNVDTKNTMTMTMTKLDRVNCANSAITAVQNGEKRQQ